MIREAESVNERYPNVNKTFGFAFYVGSILNDAPQFKGVAFFQTEQRNPSAIGLHFSVLAL